MTAYDRLVRPRKQHDLARAIPAAVVFTVPGDHDAALIRVEEFEASTTEAVAWVCDRLREATVSGHLTAPG